MKCDMRADMGEGWEPVPAKVQLITCLAVCIQSIVLRYVGPVCGRKGSKDPKLEGVSILRGISFCCCDASSLQM